MILYSQFSLINPQVNAELKFELDTVLTLNEIDKVFLDKIKQCLKQCLVL